MVSLVHKYKSSPRLTYKGGLWPARSMDQWDRHKQRLQQFCLSPGRNKQIQRKESGWALRSRTIHSISVRSPVLGSSANVRKKTSWRYMCASTHVCVLSHTTNMFYGKVHSSREKRTSSDAWEDFLWRTSHEPSLKKGIKPLGPGASLLYRTHSHRSWSISEAPTTIVWYMWETRCTYKRVSIASPRQSIQGIIHYKACLGHFKHTTGI